MLVTSSFGNLVKNYKLRSVTSRWLDIGQVHFCVFMNRGGVEVHKLAKKKNHTNIQPSWPKKLGQ